METFRENLFLFSTISKYIHFIAIFSKKYHDNFYFFPSIRSKSFILVSQLIFCLEISHSTISTRFNWNLSYIFSQDFSLQFNFLHQSSS